MVVEFVWLEFVEDPIYIRKIDVVDRDELKFIILSIAITLPEFD
jgi:hypothetical protein